MMPEGPGVDTSPGSFYATYMETVVQLVLMHEPELGWFSRASCSFRASGMSRPTRNEHETVALVLSAWGDVLSGDEGAARRELAEAFVREILHDVKLLTHEWTVEP